MSGKQLLKHIVVSIAIGAVTAIAVEIMSRFAVYLSDISRIHQPLYRMPLSALRRLPAFILSYWQDTDRLFTWAVTGGLIGWLTLLSRVYGRKQITRSTLTIILTLLWAIVNVSWISIQYQKQQSRTEIGTVYTEFCSQLQDGEYESAYAHMMSSYQIQSTVSDFVADHQDRKIISAIEAMGCDLSPRHQVRFQKHTVLLYPQNVPYITFYGGLILELQAVNGQWYFTGNGYWASD